MSSSWSIIISGTPSSGHVTVAPDLPGPPTSAALNVAVSDNVNWNNRTDDYLVLLRTGTTGPFLTNPIPPGSASSPTFNVTAAGTYAYSAIRGGFYGAYQASTWAEAVNAPGHSLWDISQAPASITLRNYAPWEKSEDSMTHVAAAAGTAIFTWNYNSNGGAPADFPAGYSVNGATTQVTSNTGAATQTGSVSFTVNQGDKFGFYLGLTTAGNHTATFTIVGFSAPTPTLLTPEHSIVAS